MSTVPALFRHLVDILRAQEITDPDLAVSRMTAFLGSTHDGA